MTVNYTTRYSARRKTLGLTVMEDATVFVDAPEGTAPETIESFVARKKAWLYRKLLPGDTTPTPPFRHPWKAGRPIVYRGRSYRLRVVDEAAEVFSFHNGFTLLRSALPQADELLEAWYKDRARERVAKLVHTYSDRLGVEAREVRVGELRSSWGSCTAKGTVTINWKLIKAPAFVLRYVVIHELAHLQQLNHSRDFWRIVSIQMPDYGRAKRWLLNEEHTIQ